MATRRNVGNDISKHVTTTIQQDDEIHIRNEFNKGNGNGRYHRILSRRAVVLGFAVAVAVLVVSMVSLIVKTESSIVAKSDDTRLRQSHHFFNNTISKRSDDVEVDNKKSETTYSRY